MGPTATKSLPHEQPRRMKPARIPGENGVFVQIIAPLSSDLQSDGLRTSAPAVQRLAGGAKAGGMGKSGEAGETAR